MAERAPGPFTVQGLDGQPIECCDRCLAWKATDGTYVTKLCPFHAKAPEMRTALERIAQHEIRSDRRHREMAGVEELETLRRIARAMLQRLDEPAAVGPTE